MLFEKGEENLEDCFWFENSKDISKEQFKKYMKEIQEGVQVMSGLLSIRHRSGCFKL